MGAAPQTIFPNRGDWATPLPVGPGGSTSFPPGLSFPGSRHEKRAPKGPVVIWVCVTCLRLCDLDTGYCDANC
jgi:hypothetical protein